MSRAGTTAAFLFATESGLCQGSATWARYLGCLTIICFPPGTDMCIRAIELFETVSTRKWASSTGWKH
ncbi:hypothetical protein WJX82_005235 [Trebouxia sp. C0006]